MRSEAQRIDDFSEPNDDVRSRNHTSVMQEQQANLHKQGWFCEVGLCLADLMQVSVFQDSELALGFGSGWSSIAGFPLQ